MFEEEEIDEIFQNDFSFVQKSWRCFLKDDKFESSFRETDAGFYGIMERIYGRRIAMNAMFSRIFYLNEDMKGMKRRTRYIF